MTTPNESHREAAPSPADVVMRQRIGDTELVEWLRIAQEFGSGLAASLGDGPPMAGDVPYFGAAVFDLRDTRQALAAATNAYDRLWKDGVALTEQLRAAEQRAVAAEVFARSYKALIESDYEKPGGRIGGGMEAEHAAVSAWLASRTGGAGGDEVGSGT